MNPSDFLQILWGTTPPGLIQLWTLETKQSRYLKLPEHADQFAAGKTDVYTAVGLSARDHGAKSRTKSDQVGGIAGFWLDLDVGKPGAAPDLEHAEQIARLMVEPTLLVKSGSGLHAWYLLKQPWVFGTVQDRQFAAKLSAQWYELHRRGARVQGWTIDGTHDLARLLRLPGTFNGKNGARTPVEVVHGPGPRMELDKFRDLCSTVGDIFQPAPPSGDVTVGVPVTEERLLELHRASGEFTRTWNHDRPEHLEWSLSEYDLALCSIAAKHGWGDPELAGLIAAHRIANHDPKGGRGDYVTRTIAKVRAGQPPTPELQKPGQLKGTLTSEGWAEHILAMLKADDDGAIAMPWKELTDALDGGLRPGELCLIAGYTSHGKSLVVDQIADHAASQGRRVHIYMTEMTAYQRGLRLMARRTGISFRTLKRRDLTVEHWKRITAEATLMNYGCSIVSDWTIDQVMTHIRTEQWDLAVIDLIHGFHYTDERELSKTSSVLVQAAKGSTVDHRGTAIIACAHLNDGQMRDARSPKRPKPGLHSIKGSSSLKQDADLVMFVWQQDDDQGKPTGEGMVWIAKSRQGSFDGVQVTLDPVRMMFVSDGEWLQQKQAVAGAVA